MINNHKRTLKVEPPLSHHEISLKSFLMASKLIDTIIELYIELIVPTWTLVDSRKLLSSFHLEFL